MTEIVNNRDESNICTCVEHQKKYIRFCCRFVCTILILVSLRLYLYLVCAFFFSSIQINTYYDLNHRSLTLPRQPKQPKRNKFITKWWLQLHDVYIVMLISINNGFYTLNSCSKYFRTKLVLFWVFLFFSLLFHRVCVYMALSCDKPKPHNEKQRQIISGAQMTWQ